jgi:hypothetical protein
MEADRADNIPFAADKQDKKRMSKAHMTPFIFLFYTAQDATDTDGGTRRCRRHRRMQEDMARAAPRPLPYR